MKKICTKCKEEKDIDLFPKAKAYKGGYSTWCKACVATAVRKSAKKYPEKIKARNKKVNNNPEVKNHKRIYNKNYRHNNRDKIQQLNRNWSKNNPLRRSMHDKISAHRRRLQKQDTDLTVDFVQKLRIETKICEICNRSLIGQKVHFDHILPLIIGGEHKKRNVRFVHVYCNLARPYDGSDLVGTKHEYLLDHKNKSVIFDHPRKVAKTTIHG